MSTNRRYRRPPAVTRTFITIGQKQVGGRWFVVLTRPSDKPQGIVTSLGKFVDIEDAKVRAAEYAAKCKSPPTIHVSLPTNRALVPSSVSG